MNKRRLRVLIVEDSEDDALLVSRELRHAGYDLAFERVETAESMNAALRREPWDVIIADYTLPKFSGMAALELLKSTGRDIPFIIVSGSIGEDLAVAAMRAGAHDYLMKGNIKRLVPSIERELRDAEGRRERRLVDAALRESEARKAAIFDSALDPIVLIDHAGKIIEFNSRAEKVFQHRRDQVIGRSLSDLVMLAGFDEGGQEAISQRLAQIVSKRIEVAGRKRDGMTFPIELSLTAVLTDIEPVFTAHIRDLSEQKKQEAIRERSRQLEEQNRRIEEASRLKNQFFAQMSHELRTPLNAIIGFSQLLFDGKAGTLAPQQREYIGDILTSGRHLLQLINDVLDLAKIEAGKMELDIKRFSLHEAVEEVASVMRPVAAERNVDLEVAFLSVPDAVTLDERRFKQVLYNLLSNAVKFSYEGGRVDVVLEGGGTDTFCLRVRDYGIGIKTEDLSRLFREFEQLDSGADRRSRGTGLGLALTKKIVEAQKGTIAVSSETGKGSLFEVTLPIVLPTPGICPNRILEPEGISHER